MFPGSSPRSASRCWRPRGFRPRAEGRVPTRSGPRRCGEPPSLARPLRPPRAPRASSLPPSAARSAARRLPRARPRARPRACPRRPGPAAPAPRPRRLFQPRRRGLPSCARFAAVTSAPGCSRASPFRAVPCFIPPASSLSYSFRVPLPRQYARCKEIICAEEFSPVRGETLGRRVPRRPRPRAAPRFVWAAALPDLRRRAPRAPGRDSPTAGPPRGGRWPVASPRLAWGGRGGPAGPQGVPRGVFSSLGVVAPSVLYSGPS